MNKIFLFLILIPFASGTQLPLGIEGTVYHNGEPVIADMIIESLNSSFSVSGNSDVGVVGRYSSAINTQLGETIKVTVMYDGLMQVHKFNVEGLHKKDFSITTAESQDLGIEKVRMPKLVIVKVNNYLTASKEVNIKTASEDYGWKNLEEFPDNQVAVVLYEPAEVTVRADGKEYSKVLSLEDSYVEFTIINYVNLIVLLSIFLLFSILFWMVKK